MTAERTTCTPGPTRWPRCFGGPPWRGAMEIDRLNEAIGLRERVNEHYLSDDVHQLGTRTLRSLVDEIEHEQQQAS